MTHEVKTPVATTQNLIDLLVKLSQQSVGGNAELTIKLGGRELIVSEVCWNDMGDGIEIRTFEAS